VSCIEAGERTAALHQHADVGGNHAPAFGKAHPALGLPADPVASDAPEFGAGGREIAPEGGDHRVLQRARWANRGAGRTKRLDCAIAVEVFGNPVAHCMRCIPEQPVERGDVVADKRRLVRCEGGDAGSIRLSHEPLRRS
jgi:hypothetical protein